MKKVGRYLATTKDKGLIMNSSQEGMEHLVDASHASEWSKKMSSYDQNWVRSRVGYIITLANCHICWSQKMQTEIAQSSTEPDYTALSQAMREVSPIMWLLEEAEHHRIPIPMKN